MGNAGGIITLLKDGYVESSGRGWTLFLRGTGLASDIPAMHTPYGGMGSPDDKGPGTDGDEIIALSLIGNIEDGIIRGIRSMHAGAVC